jgi:hypothetical protein
MVSMSLKVGKKIWLLWWVILLLEFLLAGSLIFVATSDQYGIAYVRLKEKELSRLVTSVEHPTEITKSLGVFISTSEQTFETMQAYLSGVGEVLVLFVLLQAALLLYTQRRETRSSGPGLETPGSGDAGVTH